MERMGRQTLGCLLCLWLMWSTSGFGVVRGENLGEECKDDFQSVMKCVSYATGKEDTPSKDCCSAVQAVKKNDAKCLCYIMQQTHGSSQFKSMGIQEARLLQLPSACQLQNASVSDCPRLLGLAPSSPEAAIFSNASTTAPPSATTTPGTAAPDKSGINRKHILVGPWMIAVAVFFYAFLTDFSVF